MVAVCARITDDEWDAIDVEMSGERARTRNLWRNGEAVATEGDALWLAVERSMDRAGIETGRKAGMLASVVSMSGI